MMILLLALAACGAGGRINDDFSNLEVVPEYLRTDGVLAGIGQTEFADSFLRLIVEGQGRGDGGRLFIEPDGESTFADSALEVKLRLITSGQVTLWLRSDAETCSGYGLVLDPTRDNYRLATIGDNCDVQNLDTRSRLAVDLDQWYTLRFEARGTTLRGFVDTVQFFEIEDSTYTEGQSFVEVITTGGTPAQVEVDTIRFE